jgi:NAD(P)-dependent dehydrogenase (short-subunit alcohol dehydrogenase family)
MSDQQGGVVVTGAARGIGAAIARRLAASGFRVVGVDLEGDRLRDTIGGLPGSGHLALAGDVTDESFTVQVCAAAAEAPGGLRAFVANAGLARPGDSVDYPLADWNQLLAVNLTAPFIGARCAKPHLRSGGSIVMISSINGLLGMAGRAAYCAAKAGVNGLVRSLAVEWAPDRVRVNAVSPGTIETEMGAAFMHTGFARPDTYTSRVPFGHAGQPEDIAAAVHYLCSDDGAYVTGVVLPVDGGWAINGLGKPAE